MIYSTIIWFYFAGSLAIIFVLTMAYGHAQRWSFAREQGRMLLGFAFGMVAWLQMNMPLEPMEGLIIDLCNSPLVLCGAFLGWRASLICFGVAAATRFGIGGIGMWSGILAMRISVSVGALWAYLTRSLSERKMKHMVLLSLMAPLNLSAAFILIEPAKTWFLTNASLPIAVINLVSISIAARLLDAEERKVSRENRLAASAKCDPDHGALTKPAFEREIALRVSSGTALPPTALLVIKFKYVDMLFFVVPSVWKNKLLGLVRLRVMEAFSAPDLVCSIGATALAFPLDAGQLSNKDDLQNGIKSLMRAAPFEVSNNVFKLLAVETKVLPWLPDMSLDEALQAEKFAHIRNRKNAEFWKSSIQRQISAPQASIANMSKQAMDLNNSTTASLFGKAAFLMKTKQIS